MGQKNSVSSVKERAALTPITTTAEPWSLIVTDTVHNWNNVAGNKVMNYNIVYNIYLFIIQYTLLIDS